jgi:O-antigen/teichoic acid export membrane protein
MSAVMNPAAGVEVPGARSLGAGAAWAFAGSVAAAASQWGTLAVLARLGSQETVGRYVLALAITAPITLLAGLNLRVVLVTDARREHPVGEYLALRLVTATAVVPIAALLAVAAGYGAPELTVIMAVAVTRALDLMADLFHGVQQRAGRLDRVGRSMAARAALSVAAMGGVVAWTGSLAWGAAALAPASSAVLVGYDLPRALPLLRAEPLAAGWARGAARLAWTALPLGVVTMLIALYTNIPRYFVEVRLGVAELGVFAAAASLQAVGNTVVAALGQAAVPRLAVQHAGGDRAGFRRLLARLLVGAVVLGAAGVSVAALAGGPILAFLFGPEYARGSTALLWVMAAAGAGHVAGFLGYAVTAARRFWVQLPVLGAACAAAALSCAWLVPRYGIAGAGAALLCAAFMQALAFVPAVLRAARDRGSAS